MLKRLISYVGVNDNDQSVDNLLNKVKPEMNEYLHNCESFTCFFIFIPLKAILHYSILSKIDWDSYVIHLANYLMINYSREW